MQSLRDKIAEALDDQDHREDFTPQSDEEYYRTLADAVLPILERELAGVAAVRKLHRHEHAASSWGGQCYLCNNGTWPCETIEALGEK
jgi:hypothetical protein